MVLVNHFGKFFGPQCSTAKLVRVTSFRQEQVVFQKTIPVNFGLRSLDDLHGGEVELLVLNVGYRQIWDFIHAMYCQAIFRIGSRRSTRSDLGDRDICQEA